MNQMSGRRQARVALASVGVVAALVLGGCAGMTPATPEAAVEARANARWQALIKGDYDSAYDLMSPAVRATRTRQDYKASFAGAVKWLKADVVRVECEAQRCEAMVRLEVTPLLQRGFNGNITTHMPEAWIKENDQWWFFPKP